MSQAQILIVEDEGISAVDLEDRLTRLGYRVPGIACSGLQALDLVARQHPDLVLMDIQLQGEMDGIETARELRARFDVPVAYLTAYADEDTLRRAQETGAYGYILKPVVERELHAAIQTALQRHALEQQLREELMVNAALARVGESLILGLGAHDLLDRLCHETAAALGCEFAHTWLWDSESGRAVAVAAHGHSAEEWEFIRLFKQPPRPAGDEVWQVSADRAERPLAAVMRRCGFRQLLYIPLRRGARSSGLLVAGYRSPAREFGSEQVRLATRIGQLASLVLEHARVVDELERANRTQAKLTAALSHELRGTLNVVLGYLDLLKRGEYGEVGAAVVETLERIESRVQESARIIQATLDIGRAEVKAGLQPVSLSLAAFFAELAQDGRIQSHLPAVELRWELEEDLPALETDPVKLKMVMVNLIENALKFTREGQVRVGAHASADLVEITVSDTGIGIPAEVHERIFEPFERAHASSHPQPGSGLGLYIVRKLADLLGGSIHLESEAGRGSTFRLRIPLRRG